MVNRKLKLFLFHFYSSTDLHLPFHHLQEPQLSEHIYLNNGERVQSINTGMWVRLQFMWAHIPSKRIINDETL